MFTIGQRYRYVPNGSVCRVDRIFADRHRVRITLENGQEYDEVPFHDLHDLESAVPPVPTPEIPTEGSQTPEGQGLVATDVPYRAPKPWYNPNP